MEMKYPKYNIYEELYKRYFKRDLITLIDDIDIKPTDNIIDICGGNGRLSKLLLNYSNNISYLDQEKDMIPDDLEQLGIKVYNNSIQNFIDNIDEKYDKVFCIQAINYWLLNTDIEKFSNIIKKDGLFIFNTFANIPSTIPMIKQYKIDDINYLEISYLISNKVYHIQIREGYEPHFTVFDWIDEDTINRILSPYFDIKIKHDNKTLIYTCQKK